MRSGSAGARPRGVPSRARPACTAVGGFAYLFLLYTIAVLALAASASLSLGATTSRRAAERELLAVGADLQRALRSYAQLPPGASALGARGPQALQDLLRDPRAPGLRRHLRRIPHDPITGQAQWGLLRDGSGFIVGIHSLAPGRPIQQAGFEPGQAAFTGAQTYADWVFGLTEPGWPAGSGDRDGADEPTFKPWPRRPT